MHNASKSLAGLQEEISALEDRYVLESVIGAGSYGVVIRARDNKDGGKLVAIKRVNEDIFEEATLATRILREIKLLAFFKDDNIIRLRNILMANDPENFEHIYIIMDIMDTDLKQVLRSGQVLTEAHIQFFTYQTLRALHVIHSAGVIHRDITPANILVNTNCDLKICDFGLAKEESDHGEYMTDYVTMRWYRAPELVMEDGNYSAKIDVWGVGCILGELLGSRPLFQGKDRVNQLDKIVEVIGTPTAETRDLIGSTPARVYLRKKATINPIDWREKYPDASNEALDLLKSILVFNPEKRPTVIECMRHPFFKSIYEEADEQVNSKPFVFVDDESQTVRDIKRAIYAECVRFRRECMEEESNTAGITNSTSSRAGGPSVETHGEGRSAQQTINKQTPEGEQKWSP